MRISSLQKFILLECLSLNPRAGVAKISRSRLNLFYNKLPQKTGKQPQEKFMTKIITKSIERLIDKELLVGFGERTKCKWFIKEIKLTSIGKKYARKLLGEQMNLPFRKKN